MLKKEQDRLLDRIGKLRDMLGGANELGGVFGRRMMQDIFTNMMDGMGDEEDDD